MLYIIEYYFWTCYTFCRKKDTEKRIIYHFPLREMILLSPFRQQKKLIKPDLVIRQLIIFFSSALVLSLLSALALHQERSSMSDKNKRKNRYDIFPPCPTECCYCKLPTLVPNESLPGRFSPLEPLNGMPKGV